jgi:hypothetical protein
MWCGEGRACVALRRGVGAHIGRVARHVLSTNRPCPLRTCVVEAQAAHAQLLCEVVRDGGQVKAVLVGAKSVAQHGTVPRREARRQWHCCSWCAAVAPCGLLLLRLQGWRRGSGA